MKRILIITLLILALIPAEVAIVCKLVDGYFTQVATEQSAQWAAIRELQARPAETQYNAFTPAAWAPPLALEKQSFGYRPTVAELQRAEEFPVMFIDWSVTASALVFETPQFYHISTPEGGTIVIDTKARKITAPPGYGLQKPAKK